MAQLGEYQFEPIERKKEHIQQDSHYLQLSKAIAGGVGFKDKQIFGILKDQRSQNI